MSRCWRSGIGMGMAMAMEVCLRLIIGISVVGSSEAGELRPSEHGLAYQNAAAMRGNSSEAKSFFGGTASAASKMPLPEARNMSDRSWWSDGERGGHGHGHTHVRKVLLVVSLACGITGVALLVVAAMLFIFHSRKQRYSSPSTADK